MSRGVYVQGGKCPGGYMSGNKCPGGTCPGGVLEPFKTFPVMNMC